MDVEPKLWSSSRCAWHADRAGHHPHTDENGQGGGGNGVRGGRGDRPHRAVHRGGSRKRNPWVRARPVPARRVGGRPVPARRVGGRTVPARRVGGRPVAGRRGRSRLRWRLVLRWRLTRRRKAAGPSGRRPPCGECLGSDVQVQASMRGSGWDKTPVRSIAGPGPRIETTSCVRWPVCGGRAVRRTPRSSALVHRGAVHQPAPGAGGGWAFDAWAVSIRAGDQAREQHAAGGPPEGGGVAVQHHCGDLRRPRQRGPGRRSASVGGP